MSFSTTDLRRGRERKEHSGRSNDRSAAPGGHGRRQENLLRRSSSRGSVEESAAAWTFRSLTKFAMGSPKKNERRRRSEAARSRRAMTRIRIENWPEGLLEGAEPEPRQTARMLRPPPRTLSASEMLDHADFLAIRMEGERRRGNSAIPSSRGCAVSLATCPLVSREEIKTTLEMLQLASEAAASVDLTDTLVPESEQEGEEVIHQFLTPLPADDSETAATKDAKLPLGLMDLSPPPFQFLDEAATPKRDDSWKDATNQDEELDAKQPEKKDTAETLNNIGLTGAANPQEDVIADKAAVEDALHVMVECAREFVQPPSDRYLRDAFVGLDDAIVSANPTPVSSNASTARPLSPPSSPGSLRPRSSSFASQTSLNKQLADTLTTLPQDWPLRTAMIRIRPDVLCGAVMDAVAATMQTYQGEIIKRQGSHFVCSIALSSFSSASVSVAQGKQEADAPSSQRDLRSPPPVGLTFDVQLCTRRRQIGYKSSSGDYKRILLIRVYRDHQASPAQGRDIRDVPTTNGQRSNEDETKLNDNRLPFMPSTNSSGSNGVLPSPYLDSAERNLSSTLSPLVASGALDTSITSLLEPEPSSMDGGDDSMLLREAASLLQRMKREKLQLPVNRRVLSAADDAAGLNLPETSTSKEIKSSDAQALVNETTSDSSIPCLSSGDKTEDVAVSTKGQATAEATPNVTPSEPSLPANLVASSFLRRNYDPMPSVLDAIEKLGDTGAVSRGPIFPALSRKDWPCVVASGQFLKECLNELDNRDLSFSTLYNSCPFGTFPAQPSLDAHYCTQLQSVCREEMIDALLALAAELEAYARESEEATSILVSVMSETYESYKMMLPSLPPPLPLAAYPLDFQASEGDACNPWGEKVMNALQRVAASSTSRGASAASLPNISPPLSVPSSPTRQSDEGRKPEARLPIGLWSPGGMAAIPSSSTSVSEFEHARRAVSVVVKAFREELDAEQSARLGRKNTQVMDRLTRMQEFRLQCVDGLRELYGRNVLATKAADDFHRRAQHCLKESQAANSGFLHLRAADQIPLMSCGVVIGSGTSSGTCFVTAHEILFRTTVIPVVGTVYRQIFTLVDVEFDIASDKVSTLHMRRSSSPESAESEAIVLTFVPSIGAEPFKQFVDVLKSV